MAFFSFKFYFNSIKIGRFGGEVPRFDVVVDGAI